MAKRHRSLIPLARDHHDGLILAVRLQQGKRAELKLWSHDPQLQANYVVAFYEQKLKPHFEAEEKALFPVVEKYIKAARDLVVELTGEHRLMERYVHGFRNPRDEYLETQLVEFGKLLEDHIRKEDRALFPMVEKETPQDILAWIEKEIQKSSNRAS